VAECPDIPEKTSGMANFRNFRTTVRNEFRIEFQMEVEAPRTEKSRPGESWTWAHFIKPEDKSKKEATCKICNDAGSIKVVSTANGTNVMKNHLNTTHKIFKPVDAEPESKKPRSNAPDDRLINILLTNFFGECHIPLSVVDHPAFIELLSTACPTYKLPTRNTLRSRIIGEAANIKNMVCSVEK